MSSFIHLTGSERGASLIKLVQTKIKIRVHNIKTLKWFLKVSYFFIRFKTLIGQLVLTRHIVDYNIIAVQTDIVIDIVQPSFFYIKSYYVGFPGTPEQNNSLCVPRVNGVVQM